MDFQTYPKYTLLPQDRYLAHLLGWSEEDLLHYKREVFRIRREANLEGPQAGLETIAIISAVSAILSVGFQIAASFFTPEPAKRGTLTQKQKQGDILQVPTAFAATYGWESIQEIAPLGDPIPIIYAKREQLDGVWYGGVRVNTPLLWSRMDSNGGSQTFQGVFLLGEGSMPQIDPNAIALGNNTLGAYAFDQGERAAIYYRADGGRVSNANLIKGDDTLDGGNEPFTTFEGNTADQYNFCAALKPNSSTRFGLFAPCANDMAVRVNPQIRPLRTLVVEDEEYEANDEAQALADTWKAKYAYGSKSAISSSSGTGVGAGFTYTLSVVADGFGNKGTSADQPVRIQFGSANTDNSVGSEDGEARLTDVSARVAGQQRQYESNLVVGELYKVGTALAILTSKTGNLVSEGDFSWASIENSPSTSPVTCNFRIVRAGTYNQAPGNWDDYFTTASRVTPPANAGQIWEYQTPGTSYSSGDIGNRHSTASNQTHIFRCAIGNVALNRPCQYFEIGIKSRLGITIQGLCNFNDMPTENAGYSYNLGDGGAILTLDPPPSQTGLSASITFASNVTSNGSGTNASITVTTSPTGTLSPWNYVINTGGEDYEVGDVITFQVPDSQGTRNVSTTVASVSQGGTGNITAKAFVPPFEVINDRAANNADGRKVDKDTQTTIFQSGQITLPEKRYSFFRISIRKNTNLTNDFLGSVIFGVAGAQSIDQFNNLRFAMNEVAYWEVRFEPLSAWEVRNQLPSALNILDENVGTQQSYAISTLGTIWAPTYTISNERSTFVIEAAQPPKEIGISWTEGNFGTGTDLDPINGTYLDEWGRCAEMFAYSEVTTTALQAPEHEISYVNLIQTPTAWGGDPAGAQYDNLSMLGLIIRSGQEFNQLSQVSAYVEEGKEITTLDPGGTGPSHLFPEILRDLMLNTRYGLGNEIIPDQVDDTSFTAAATFCHNNRFFYDGPKLNNSNWRQWAADTAALHQLLFLETGGTFKLIEAAPQTVTIAGIFTEGNTLPESLQVQSTPIEQREPFKVSVKYREEKYEDGLTGGIGMFPEPKEVLVSNVNWNTDQVESIDMSDFCTNRDHAIAAAKYIIASRRLNTYTVSFETTYEALGGPLAPGDFIRVGFVNHFDATFINGAIDDAGNLITNRDDITAGSYNAFYWDGVPGNPVTQGTVTVSGSTAIGFTGTPTNILFTLTDSGSSTTGTFRIESIEPSEAGYAISAVFAPTTGTTYDLYTEIATPGNWETV